MLNLSHRYFPHDYSEYNQIAFTVVLEQVPAGNVLGRILSCESDSVRSAFLLSLSHRVSAQFTTSRDSATSPDDVTGWRLLAYVTTGRCCCRRRKQIAPRSLVALLSCCHGDAASHVTLLLTRREFVSCHVKTVVSPSTIVVRAFHLAIR